MNDYPIEKEKLFAITEQMRIQYGCSNSTSASYAELIIFCVAEYYDEMMNVFLEAFSRNLLTNIELNIRLLRLYSEYMISHKKYSEMNNSFSKIDDLFFSAELHNSFGISLFYDKRYDEALGEFKRAYKIKPLKKIRNNIIKVTQKIGRGK